MKRIRLALLAATMALLPSLAFAMGSDHQADGPIVAKHWPKGVSELVNTDARVHGFWVNGYDQFAFSGDTDRLNAFLKAYGKIEGATREVVIHASAMKVRSPWDKAPRDIEGDWSLSIDTNRSTLNRTVPLKMQIELPDRLKHALPVDGRTVEVDGTLTVVMHIETAVHIYLGGGIDLDALEMPSHVKVRSARDIERFVERHEAARASNAGDDAEHSER